MTFFYLGFIDISICFSRMLYKSYPEAAPNLKCRCCQMVLHIHNMLSGSKVIPFNMMQNTYNNNHPCPFRPHHLCFSIQYSLISTHSGLQNALMSLLSLHSENLSLQHKSLYLVCMRINTPQFLSNYLVHKHSPILTANCLAPAGAFHDIKIILNSPASKSMAAIVQERISLT